MAGGWAEKRSTSWLQRCAASLDDDGHRDRDTHRDMDLCGPRCIPCSRSGNKERRRRAAARGRKKKIKTCGGRRAADRDPTLHAGAHASSCLHAHACNGPLSLVHVPPCPWPILVHANPCPLPMLHAMPRPAWPERRRRPLGGCGVGMGVPTPTPTTGDGTPVVDAHLVRPPLESGPFIYWEPWS